MPEFIQGQPALSRIRWIGSGSSPSGSTPYGYFDNESLFVSDAPKAANWAARRLGYPVVDVELTQDEKDSYISYRQYLRQFIHIANFNNTQWVPFVLTYEEWSTATTEIYEKSLGIYGQS